MSTRPLIAANMLGAATKVATANVSCVLVSVVSMGRKRGYSIFPATRS